MRRNDFGRDGFFWVSSEPAQEQKAQLRPARTAMLPNESPVAAHARVETSTPALGLPSDRERVPRPPWDPRALPLWNGPQIFDPLAAR